MGAFFNADNANSSDSAAVVALVLALIVVVIGAAVAMAIVLRRRNQKDPKTSKCMEDLVEDDDELQGQKEIAVNMCMNKQNTAEKELDQDDYEVQGAKEIEVKVQKHDSKKQYSLYANTACHQFDQDDQQI